MRRLSVPGIARFLVNPEACLSPSATTATYRDSHCRSPAAMPGRTRRYGFRRDSGIPAARPRRTLYRVRLRIPPAMRDANQRIAMNHHWTRNEQGTAWTDRILHGVSQHEGRQVTSCGAGSGGRIPTCCQPIASQLERQNPLSDRSSIMKTKHDRSRFDIMTDKQVHAAALADPDAQPLTGNGWWR